MKAVRLTRHGKPGVLMIEDLPPSVPGPEDALVRIMAACINPSDVRKQK